MLCSAIRYIAAISAIALVATLSVAVAGEHSYSGRSGQAVTTRGYSSWDANCAGQAASVDLTSAPSNGVVSFGAGRQTINTSLRRNCNGKQMPTRTVVYRSNAGFHGTDQFVVTAHTEGGDLVDTIRVTVR